jgi:hypothetical protein
MAGDIVDKDAVFENTQVHFNPEQKWYYLPDQMPEELLIFKNADSQKSGGMPGKFISIFLLSGPCLELVFFRHPPFIWLTTFTRCTTCIF